jgi:hypothetical protein
LWQKYNTLLVDRMVHFVYNHGMVEVKNKTETREFESLEQAMAWAKTLDEFVSIHVNGHEFVGLFGSDEITQGVLPDGHAYTWKKRRL